MSSSDRVRYVLLIAFIPFLDNTIIPHIILKIYSSYLIYVILVPNFSLNSLWEIPNSLRFFLIIFIFITTFTMIFNQIPAKQVFMMSYNKNNAFLLIYQVYFILFFYHTYSIKLFFSFQNSTYLDYIHLSDYCMIDCS